MKIENNLAPEISLSGAWEFCLGESTSWGIIQAPGCWEAQGYSKMVEGPALYRREVSIPAEWTGRRIWLEFDAVSYACRAMVNGVCVGEHRGMWTPFIFDATEASHPGEVNSLELEVWKPGEKYPMRAVLAGFLPDVATTFGGVWQGARLRACEVGFENLHVDAEIVQPPEPASQSQPRQGIVKVCFSIANLGISDVPIAEGEWILQVFIRHKSRDGQVSSIMHAQPIPMESQPIDLHLAVPDLCIWSPENPELYEVQVALLENGQALACASRRVGFRTLAKAGDQLLFNRQPVCLRGILSWGWDPGLIAPAFTPEQAREEFHRIHSLGFNMVKLCLFIPNQAYFDAADEEGIFLWVEMPMWLPQIPPDALETYPLEYAEYMDLTRGHPSVILYSAGCELDRSVNAKLLDRLSEAMRTRAFEVLFCENSGSGEAYGGLSVDASDFTDYHPYSDLHFFEPLLDNWRRDWQPPKPLIFGEFCDCDGFRDLDEVISACGGVRPWWMTEDIPVHTWRPEVYALIEQYERLAQANLNFSMPELVKVANEQARVVRKYVLESVRRRSGMGGYVITGLRDTPLATSGVFDDLGRPKWSPEAFTPFNQDTMLCLDVERRRKWTHGGDRVDHLDGQNYWAGESAVLHIIVSHTREALDKPGQLAWELKGIREQATVYSQGSLDQVHGLAPGRPYELGAIEFSLPELTQASELLLEARLSVGVKNISNSWPVWVYPKPTAERSLTREESRPAWPVDLALYGSSEVLEAIAALLPEARRLSEHVEPSTNPLVISSTLDAELMSYLHGGGKILLLQQGEGPLPCKRAPFWREAVKLFYPHPIWQHFPHQGFTDMQFFGLGTDVILDSSRLGEVLPGMQAVQPILRRLDARSFQVAEYIHEAQVGKGTLLVCSLRLQGGAGSQPTGFQRNIAGQYLLWVMVKYLSEDQHG